jgi:hypothetical protein
MSGAKALCPNRRLRQSKKIDRLSRAAEISSAEFPLEKIRLARNSFEPAQCGYSGQTSTGNDRDDDDDCGNNDGRRTGSMAGNRIDNKVWRNTGTDKSTRKGNIRNSPDRTRY